MTKLPTSFYFCYSTLCLYISYILALIIFFPNTLKVLDTQYIFRHILHFIHVYIYKYMKYVLIRLLQPYTTDFNLHISKFTICLSGNLLVSSKQQLQVREYMKYLSGIPAQEMSHIHRDTSYQDLFDPTAMKNANTIFLTLVCFKKRNIELDKTFLSTIV